MGHGGSGISAWPRQEPTADFVGRHAERKNVQPTVALAAADDFRSHVVRCASAIAWPKEGWFVGHRQTEVEERHLALGAEHEVSWADVTMNEACFMDCC